MQDAFVGGFCVIGFMLATYMGGEPKTWDFWVSLLAGIAVLGVVFFPTSRPPDQASSGACGSPKAIGCSPVESTLGEHQTALVHAACAVVLIICLAIMSFLFGLAEVVTDNDRSMSSGQRIQGKFWNPVLFWTYSGLALVILAAGAWASWGAPLGNLKPLYIGEVAAVWAFGISWLLAGFYLTAPHRSKPDTSEPVPVGIPGPSATTDAGEPRLAGPELRSAQLRHSSVANPHFSATSLPQVDDHEPTRDQWTTPSGRNYLKGAKRYPV